MFVLTVIFLTPLRDVPSSVLGLGTVFIGFYIVFPMSRRQISGLDLNYAAVIPSKLFPALPLPSDRIIQRRIPLDVVLTRTVNKQQINYDV
jgi:hypothetical protein